MIVRGDSGRKQEKEKMRQRDGEKAAADSKQFAVVIVKLLKINS